MGLLQLISLIACVAPLTNSVRPGEVEDPLSRAGTASGHKALTKDAAFIHVAVAAKSSFAALSSVKKDKVQNHTANSNSPSHSSSRSHAGSTAECSGSEAHPLVKEPWMDVLFETLDADAGGNIDDEEWKKLVKGPWAEPMWDELHKTPDTTVVKEEFMKFWCVAVSAAFKEMGGADGEIDAEDIKKWRPEGDDKIGFSNDERLAHLWMYLGDKVMDRHEFEEFLFTVVLFQAVDENNDEFVSFDEIKDKPLGAQLPKTEEDFDKEFELVRLDKEGKEEEKMKGMDLFMFHKYLHVKLHIFGDTPVGGKEPEPENLKPENPIPDNGSVRTKLAYAVVAVLLACVWQ